MHSPACSPLVTRVWQFRCQSRWLGSRSPRGAPQPYWAGTGRSSGCGCPALAPAGSSSPTAGCWPTRPEMAFSATKSIVSLVAGAGFDDGELELDAPVYDAAALDEFAGLHAHQIHLTAPARADQRMGWPPLGQTRRRRRPEPARGQRACWEPTGHGVGLQRRAGQPALPGPDRPARTSSARRPRGTRHGTAGRVRHMVLARLH